MPSITVLAASAIDDNAVGTAVWNNPGNVTADDDSRAEVSPPGRNGVISHYLRATPASLAAIPGSSDIDGIEIRVNRKRSGSAQVRTENARVYKDGTGYVGIDKGSSDLWSSSDTTEIFGGSTDLWGTTWTRDEVVNDLRFGISADLASNSTGEIDYIEFTIHYTVTAVAIDVDVDADWGGLGVLNVVKLIAVNKPPNWIGSGSIEAFKRLMADISANWSGSGSLTGGIKAISVNKPPSWIGTGSLAGFLRSISVNKPPSWIGAGSIEAFKRLLVDISADWSGVGSLTRGTAFYQFATTYGVPSEDKPYPVTYLEIGDLSGAPVNEPTSGRYLEVINNHPPSSVTTTESIFGIRTFSDMEISIDNKDFVFSLDTDLRGISARVFQKKDGVFKKLFVGKVAGRAYGQNTKLRLKDSFKDSMFTDMGRVITTEDYPLARDVGSKIPIAVGRNRRLGPLPIIEYDDVNRIFRYACGEGVGYNNGSWSQIFTAYFGEVAFKETTGTVLSGTSNSVRLEIADRRPNDFLKFQWITIDNQTPKFITTNDENTDCIIDGTFDVAPTGGETYVIRPWRFYDGSQVSPYPGLAFLEFKFPVVNGSTFLDVYADCDALQEEKNLIRFIQSIISNTTWGKGLAVDAAQFDTAAALSFVMDIDIEGNYTSNQQVIQVLTELFSYRNVTLTECESGIGIEVETLRDMPDAFYDLGTVRENIYENSLDEVNEKNTDEIIKTVKASYRYDNFKGDYIHKGLERSANSVGKEKAFEMKYIYGHETADRVLDFLRKLYASQAAEWRFSGSKEATLKKTHRLSVNVDIEGMKVFSDWRIKDIVEHKDKFDFVLNPYPSNAFTYEASPSLPVDEIGIEPFFDETPPDPLANVAISYTQDFDESGVLQVFAVFSFDAPESNFDEARVLVRRTGQTVWNSGGAGAQNPRVPVTPGINFDYQIAPYNSNGISGLAETFINQLVPGDNTTPKTPTNLIGKGGLENMSWEWDAVTRNTDNSTIEDLAGYQYRIYTAQFGGTQVYPKQAGGVRAFTTDTQVNINDLEGDLTAIQRTLWLEIRAIDNTERFKPGQGNPSATIGRVEAGTRAVDRDDLEDNTTMDIVAVSNRNELPGVTQTLNTWYLVLETTITVDRTVLIKVRYNSKWVDTGAGFELKMLDNGSEKKSFDYGGSVNGLDATLEHTFSVSSGSHTIRIETRNTVSGGTGLGLVENSLSVQGDFK